MMKFLQQIMKCYFIYSGDKLEDAGWEPSHLHVPLNYTAGTLVLCKDQKVTWPAMIDYCPDSGRFYSVWKNR